MSLLKTTIFLSILLLTKLSHADQNHPNLKILFQELKNSSSPKKIESKIWELWLKHNNPEIESAMNESIVLMNSRHKSMALKGFSKIIEIDPNYSEAWNKRATVYYIMMDFDKSIVDIAQTLLLEPNHFGALSGLAMIYYQQGKKELTKEVIFKLIEIYPDVQLPSYLKNLIKPLKNKET